MVGGAGPEADPTRLSLGSLVGRDLLVDELSRRAAASAGGQGSVIVLSGEAGIGKTSVAREIAARASAELQVSWGSAPADRGAPPFAPWNAFIDPPSTRPVDPAMQAIGAPRHEQLRELGDQAVGLAHARARLHVLEDLQWADVASVLLLAHLGGRIVDVPLMVIATVRTDEERSPSFQDALEQVQRNAVVHELTPLRDDAVAALIRRSGAVADRALVAVVQRRTGGNPLFVTELLRALPATGPASRRSVAESVPARISDLVLHRLHRLPPPVPDTLATAAVVGAEGDIATLAAAHGSRAEPLLEQLDQARAAHLLDAAEPGRWRFRHALVRDAIYTNLPAGERVTRHARVLDALALDPSRPAALLAHHALAAQPIVDAERAVALAARAGEDGLAHRAYEEAVSWFGRALDAAPPETSARWRAELLVRSGEASRQVGDTASARASFVAAAALTDDADLLARAALGHADPGADLGIAFRTYDAISGPLLERAISAQPSSDSDTAVRLRSRLAADHYFSDDPGRSRALATGALEDARRLGAPGPLGAALAVVHDAFVVGQAPLAEQLAGSTELLQLARSTGSTSALLTAHRARVLDLLAAGDLQAVDREILAFRRLADPLRAPGYRWWVSLWSAMRALLEGRHDLAEERAVEAYELGHGPFPALAFSNLSFLLFFLRREQGRLAEMEQPTRDAAAAQADVPAIRAALVLLLAELGQHEEAEARLGEFDDSALAPLHDRNWPASWFQLARAAYLVGHADVAARLLEPRHQPTERCVQVSLGTVCLGATDLARAWLLHVQHDLEGADAAFRSAASLNARIGARSWLAQAQRDHGRLLLERGGDDDLTEAAQLHHRAQATALELGLAPISQSEGARRPSDGPRRASEFRRAGSVWHLAFGDREVVVPDGRGLRDIAFLLSRPGEAISVLELAGDGAKAPVEDRGPDALDERARQEIRSQLRALDDDEADAEAAGDGERAALARERRQILAETVARDFGLGGRSRRLGDPIERTRKTVSTRIRRTIATVGRAHPELGRHLDRSIDTGTWCAYRPAEPMVWRT